MVAGKREVKEEARVRGGEDERRGRELS